MTSQRRLGRGLEALLSRVAGEPESPATPNPPEPAVPDENPQSEDASAAHPPEIEEPVREPVEAAQPDGLSPPPASEPDEPQRLQTLPIERIDSNPFQPRQDFDEAEMASLRESLVAHGLLQPVVVRQSGDRYQLVAGERRLRAAAAAGWTDVPVQLVEADDRQMAELAIVENLQRKDLNALEKAASFQRYLEQYGATQEELAGRLKLDRSTIANLIRLLELPPPVQEAIRQGKITPGHARALLPLGDEREQVEFCERIQREGMSVRQTERAVQERIEEADGTPLGVIGRDGKSSRSKRIQSDHLAALEQEFKAALGSRVRITHSGRGRGKLVVLFSSHEEFERIRRHVCGFGSEPQSHVG